jgi:hypothetical protein
MIGLMAVMEDYRFNQGMTIGFTFLIFLLMLGGRRRVHLAPIESQEGCQRKERDRAIEWTTEGASD